MNLYGEVFPEAQLRFNYSSSYAVATNPRQGLKQLGPYDSNLFGKACIRCGIIYPATMEDAKKLLIDGLVNGESGFVGFQRLFRVPLSFEEEQTISLENAEEIRRVSSGIGSEDLDLVFILTSRRNSPLYQACKGELLGNGVPNQVIIGERLERLIGPEAVSEETMTSIFEKKLNTLFQEEYIGYCMVEGQIEKIGTGEFDQAVAEAVEQLGVPCFEVPLRQFRKALAFRNAMPPDYSNAVKEAVNAVEGVYQVVGGMPGTALPTILSGLSPPLPSGLRKLYDGLYGYGSGSEGARHAGIGGHTPEAEEAEFIVHTAAAAITYAIKTYG